MSVLMMSIVFVLFAIQVFGADLSSVISPDAMQTGRDLIHTPNLEIQDIPLPKQVGGMEWEGYISRQPEELLTVITDTNEWTALWSKAFNKLAPEVDLDENAIACVFLGFHAGWLYDIHIGEPVEEGSVAVVPYGLNEIILRLSGPFQASGQYRMKAVQKKKGYVMVLEKR